MSSAVKTGQQENKFQDVFRKMPEEFHDELPKIYRSDKTRIFRLGERGSGLESFHPEVQDFASLKANMLQSRTLFEDRTFDSVNSSLYYSRSSHTTSIVWMRPGQIVKNPIFVDPAARKFHMKQLFTGNCGFLAALSTVTRNNTLFDQMIPDHQNFTSQYAGIFHFRFWQFGKWIDVVIDDFLPMSLEKVEYIQKLANPTFWSCLLEKAYAKLYGSYEGILEIYLNDSLVDMTGGVSDFITPEEGDPAFELLQDEFNHGTLMGATTKGISSDLSQAFLIDQHHIITAVAVVVNKSKEQFQLLKLKDTAGGGLKWTGAWSEGSELWSTLEGDTTTLKSSARAHGEFWISYKDFRKYFNRQFLCYLDPQLVDHSGKVQPWHMTTFHNSWILGSSGGDILNSTYHKNPQYAITLNMGASGIRGQWMLVSLMQRYRKRSRQLLEIGVAVFAIPPGKDLPLNMEYLKTQFAMQKFNHARETTSRYNLPAGRYCIIPSTAYPKTQCDFILRIITENPITYSAHDHKISIDKVDYKVLIEEAPQLSPRVEKYFYKVARETEDIDWLALKKLLDYALSSCGVCIYCPMFRKGPVLSKDACRSMVANIDSEGVGRLSYKQFKVLWAEIHKLKGIYDHYSTDEKKRMPCSNLNKALHAAGFTLNYQVLGILANRYGSKDTLQIEFDDFLIIVMRLKIMLYLFFENADPQVPDMPLPEWLSKTVYC